MGRWGEREKGIEFSYSENKTGRGREGEGGGQRERRKKNPPPENCLQGCSYLDFISCAVPTSQANCSLSTNEHIYVYQSRSKYLKNENDQLKQEFSKYESSVASCSHITTLWFPRAMAHVESNIGLIFYTVLS